MLPSLSPRDAIKISKLFPEAAWAILDFSSGTGRLVPIDRPSANFSGWPRDGFPIGDLDEPGFEGVGVHPSTAAPDAGSNDRLDSN